MPLSIRPAGFTGLMPGHCPVAEAGQERPLLCVCVCVLMHMTEFAYE